jgi:hypothetical protein
VSRPIVLHVATVVFTDSPPLRLRSAYLTEPGRAQRLPCTLECAAFDDDHISSVHRALGIRP